MDIIAKAKSAGRCERLELRATCCTCNTDLDLDEQARKLLLGADTRLARRHVIEPDSACRECGANRRRLVVRALGHR